ncbi:MAG: hypothetical protein NT069_29990, partial [Planctomycetota bacterium]|nr:hypothetical protein [Planctomycetota bacterium]
MAKQPQAQLPRWQAGFVKEQGNWVSFDASRSANPLDPRLAAYRKRRAEAESTFAAQYELANWCKQQKLPDQERVHLLAALNLASDPQKDPLLPRLGYKRFGGMWLSREQMVQIQKECDSAQSSMTQWATKLEKIARDLKGKPLVALAASAELRQMDDPEVIPAMEQVFAARSEEGAEIAIGVFDRISAPEATEALTRQAVFSPWEKARDRGALALKNRKFEDFVPDLLALLAIPRGTSFQIAETTAMNRTGTGWLAVGRLDYRYTIAVETGDEIQVASLGVFNYVTTDALTR